MYWQAENSVTIHPLEEVRCSEEGIGQERQVAFGKKLHSGVVAAVGKLA